MCARTYAEPNPRRAREEYLPHPRSRNNKRLLGHATIRAEPLGIRAERRGPMATQLAPGLARKVKKVLETRADTPETIACLKGLSEFYGENTPAARRGARSRACRTFLPFLRCEPL